MSLSKRSMTTEMQARTLCVFFVIFHTVSGALFLRRDDAHGLLLPRARRANSGFFEELKKGNLERECNEEICDYEEAREVFEDDAKTRAFWLTYHAREPCLANPCQNNGTCIYVKTSYQCQCMDGFEGKYCQEVFEETLKCMYLNGGCEQFCDGSGPRRKCSCASGYVLGENGKSCLAQVQYPCGRVPLLVPQVNRTEPPNTRIVGGNQCPKGHCPWQVLLEYKGQSLCGGVLVGLDWVITAAHCLDNRQIKHLTVVTGEHDLEVQEGTEQRLPVSQAIVQDDYDSVTLDGDLALLRLSEPAVLSAHVVPVCLPTAPFAKSELAPTRFHTLSGWGHRTRGGNDPPLSQSPPAPTSPVLRRLAVPFLPTAECASISGVNVTANMLCAGYVEGSHESCRGDDGSPLVTEYTGTYFLTGVVSWGRGCTKPGYYGIYTKVSNFLDWLGQQMATTPSLGDSVHSAKTATAKASPSL